MLSSLPPPRNVTGRQLEASVWGRGSVLFIAFLVGILACRQEDRKSSGEDWIRWVEARLRCIPRSTLVCETRGLPARTAQVEGEAPWAEAVFAEEEPGGSIRALVVRRGRRTGASNAPWEYRFTQSGEVLERRCLSNLPAEGASLRHYLRAPDYVFSGGLAFSDGCEPPEWPVPLFELEEGRLRLVQALWRREGMFGPYKSDTSREAIPGSRGAPTDLQSDKLDRTYFPIHVLVGSGRVEAAAAEGWGAVSDAGVPELLWLAAAHGDSESLSKTLAMTARLTWEARGLPRDLEEDDRLDAEDEARRKEYVRWIDWIREKNSKGETAFEALRPGQDLQGKSVLLGASGRLIVEAGGVPLLFEAEENGARVEVEAVRAMDSSWRALAEALKKQGLRGPVLASPPYFLADRTLYRVDEGGMSVACRELRLRDGCRGTCGKLRRLGTTYAGGALLFIWTGGAKVGTCLDG